MVSVILLGCEVALLRRLHFIREEDMYVMLIPTAVFFLLVALQLKVKKPVGILRKMSMNIYFVHMIFKFGYREWIGQADENGMALFLFTLSGTLITAFILSVLGNVRVKKQEPGIL